jgi:general secretion pathway protein B
MSLILDALRRAESDRRRGAVPGLHGPGTMPPSVVPVSRSRAGWVAALLLGAAGLLALGWRGGSMPAQSPAQSPAQLAAQSPAQTPAPTAPAAPLPLVVSAPTAPAPAPVATAKALEPAAPPRSASAPAPIVTQLRRPADLPAEQRRELPPLAVSGSVWSEQTASRFVVIDGQVLREGERLAPGLVLVKLAPRSATLSWRGELIELAY